MQDTLDTTVLVAELEARQDEALRQLAELERRIDAVLADLLPKAERTAEKSAAPAATSAPIRRAA
jgi:hypothetical protein